MQNKPPIVDVSPDQLERWLDAGEAVLVDVREEFEHAAERIEGAQHRVLSKLNPNELRAQHPGKRIVFHCRSGARSAQAAQRMAEQHAESYHLEGGIEGWKASGRPTFRAAGAPRIDVMRQVQISAGSLVVLGIALGVLVSPWLLILSAFVGAGLIFAGASGWCGMAMLLSRMPWNRVSLKPPSPSAHSTPHPGPTPATEGSPA